MDELHLQALPLEYLKESQTCLQSVCYSNTDFVLQSDYKDCVFDMELAYIAALGFQNLCSLKIVSDNLSLHAYREVAAGVESFASQHVLSKGKTCFFGKKVKKVRKYLVIPKKSSTFAPDFERDMYRGVEQW